MAVRWLFLKILWSITTLGIALEMDLSIAPSDAGFLLKPLFGDQHKDNPTVDENMFVITNPRGHVRVEGFYGPYDAEAMVSPSFLQRNQSSHVLGPITLGNDLDLSAHLVSWTINQERPLLQVLFHASQMQSQSLTKSRKNQLLPGQTYCLQVHVILDQTELSASCELFKGLPTCMAQVNLPPTWWDSQHIRSLDVFYSAYIADGESQCSIGTNAGEDIVAARNLSNMRSYVGTVTLTTGQLTYQEVKEDQHILIYLPQKSYHPGSQFRVPVKLQAESDLEIFVVRVKARSWLKVVGAEAKNPEKWRITLDSSKKKHGAMVTAFVHDKDDYTKTDSIQDVFEWIFEVDKDADSDESGRMVFNLEYEMTLQQKETYGSIQNRVVARVHIQHDNILSIVPIIKMTELVNTAMLTGKTQSWNMKVYGLANDAVGTITDITAKTTCHSGDETVLKVAESCSLVYLDGSEYRGSSSVNVIAKYGRHTKFIFFKVWVPELPLEVVLSDSRLSQIKSWKAPAHLDYRPTSSADEDSTDETGQGKTSQATCQLRFQQSTVDVYAHFVIPEVGREQYLTHRKAAFRVTNLLEGRMRVADNTVASLHGTVLLGLKQGRTEIQVLSRMGRVIGVHEVKVGNNKVTMEKLRVTVVSGMRVSIRPNSPLPGTLLARATKLTRLTKKYQEAILDINIDFSDGTSLPLSQVPPSDYFLDMTTLNNHVVAFGPMQSPAQPRVIALGKGKGELLKLSLELGDACQRKKARALAVSYIYTDVDFEESDEDLQNDMQYKKMQEHFTDMLAKGVEQEVKGDPEINNNYVEGVDKNFGGLEVIEENYAPSHEAQQQHVRESRNMTALEIGMYVLLAVFCLAISVFAINCVVFVYRYRHKRLPYEQPTSNVQNAGDWVWIGRTTLERNAIQTDPITALMPDEDFNGNQGLLQQVADHHSNPGTPVGTGPSTASGGTNTTGEGGSNRNSFVSTYKGSECSIRITSNPHPEAGGTAPPEGASPQHQAPTQQPDLHEEDEEMEVDESEAEASADPDETNNNAGINPSEVVQWDYEAMGLTYDQLMDYFDNLKESTA